MYSFYKFNVPLAGLYEAVKCEFIDFLINPKSPLSSGRSIFRNSVLYPNFQDYLLLNNFSLSVNLIVV